MARLWIIAAATLLMVHPSASASSTRTCPAKLAFSAVVDIAERMASTKIQNRETYNLARVLFDCARKEWTVVFWEKVVRPDACFTIIVNDHSGEAQVHACP